MLIRLWLLYRRFHHIQDVFLSSLLLFLKLHHRANGAVAIVMALMVAVHSERTILKGEEEKRGDGKVKRGKKWAEGELCSRPARLRFWEMDPRDKPEDDSAY